MTLFAIGLNSAFLFLYLICEHTFCCFLFTSLPLPCTLSHSLSLSVWLLLQEVSVWMKAVKEKGKVNIWLVPLRSRKKRKELNTNINQLQSSHACKINKEKSVFNSRLILLIHGLHVPLYRYLSICLKWIIEWLSSVNVKG